MTNHRPVLKIVTSSFSVIAVVALIALWAAPAAAQSGRRAATRSSSAPAPTPTPEAEPVTRKPADETGSELSFIVGIDQVSNFTTIPNYLNDSVLRACAERLDDSPSVKVTVANRDMSRGEAIKKAKAETKSHIVWMQLRYDNVTGVDNEDLSRIYIDYWVFAPTTAKIVTNGRSFQQSYRGGGAIVVPRPGGRASLSYTEQLLKQAARDAAQRILAAMELPGRSVPGGAGSLEFKL